MALVECRAQIHPQTVLVMVIPRPSIPPTTFPLPQQANELCTHRWIPPFLLESDTEGSRLRGSHLHRLQEKIRPPFEDVLDVLRSPFIGMWSIFPLKRTSFLNMKIFFFYFINRRHCFKSVLFFHEQKRIKLYYLHYFLFCNNQCTIYGEE